jgi:tetraacyldisaccharide 4'-kinase
MERVVAGASGAAARFGDEPVMIARRTGVQVWVGEDRFGAGAAAERGMGGVDQKGRQKTQIPFGNDKPMGNDEQGRVHVLDDGFQHRGLARAVDVVVVTEEDLEDALLPAGNRREPLGALRRADVVVVREEERERVEAQVRELMREDARVWSVRRQLQFADEDGAAGVGAGVTGATGAWARAGAMSAVAFCAIARPEGFWAMLKEAGCEVVETVAFGDHHRYGRADVERIVAIARERGATGFLTTEKDAVKLTRSMMERLEQVGAVVVARLDAAFVDEAEVGRELEALIG